MASVPEPSEPQERTPAPMPLGIRGRGGRRTIVRAVTAPGRVARGAAMFTRSLATGFAIRADGTMHHGVPQVRVPDGAWAFRRADDDTSDLPSDIDPALAAIAARYRQKSAARPRDAAPAPPKGLPSVLRRRAQSRSGANTGPSGVVRAMRPADTYVPRNEGHQSGPFTTASAKPARRASAEAASSVARRAAGSARPSKPTPSAAAAAARPPARTATPTPAPTRTPSVPAPARAPEGEGAPLPTGAGAAAAAAWAARLAAAFEGGTPAPDATAPTVPSSTAFSTNVPPVVSAGERTVAARVPGAPRWAGVAGLDARRTATVDAGTADDAIDRTPAARRAPVERPSSFTRPVAGRTAASVPEGRGPRSPRPSGTTSSFTPPTAGRRGDAPASPVRRAPRGGPTAPSAPSATARPDWRPADPSRRAPARRPVTGANPAPLARAIDITSPAGSVALLERAATDPVDAATIEPTPRLSVLHRLAVASSVVAPAPAVASLPSAPWRAANAHLAPSTLRDRYRPTAWTATPAPAPTPMPLRPTAAPVGHAASAQPRRPAAATAPGARQRVIERPASAPSRATVPRTRRTAIARTPTSTATSSITAASSMLTPTTSIAAAPSPTTPTTPTTVTRPAATVWRPAAGRVARAAQRAMRAVTAPVDIVPERVPDAAAGPSLSPRAASLLRSVFDRGGEAAPPSASWAAPSPTATPLASTPLASTRSVGPSVASTPSPVSPRRAVVARATARTQGVAPVRSANAVTRRTLATGRSSARAAAPVPSASLSPVARGRRAVAARSLSPVARGRWAVAAPSPASSPRRGMRPIARATAPARRAVASAAARWTPLAHRTVTRRPRALPSLARPMARGIDRAVVADVRSGALTAPAGPPARPPATTASTAPATDRSVATRATPPNASMPHASTPAVLPPAVSGSGARAATAWADRLAAAWGAPDLPAASTLSTATSVPAPSDAAAPAVRRDARVRVAAVPRVVARMAAGLPRAALGRGLVSAPSPLSPATLASRTHLAAPAQTARRSLLADAATTTVHPIAARAVAGRPSVPASTPTRPHAAPAVATATGGDQPRASTTPAQLTVAAVRQRPAHRRHEMAHRLARAASTGQARPLPTIFTPLARQLGAEHAVVVHDAAARDALRTVARPAAAVDGTILLDRRPDRSPVMAERIAHELVHVANTRSDRPRLFGDPQRDGEERTAHRIGRLAKTLGPEAVPGALGAATALPVRIGAIDTPVTATTSSAPGGRITAGPEAATVARTVTAEGRTLSRAVRRSPVRRSTMAPAASAADRATSTTLRPTVVERDAPVRRAVDGTPASSSSPAKQAMSAAGPGASHAPVAEERHHESATARLDRVDELVALIEERVLAELERRGGRHRGWI